VPQLCSSLILTPVKLARSPLKDKRLFDTDIHWQGAADRRAQPPSWAASQLGLTEPELEASGGLFQTDDDGQPVVPITGLHESVLDTDPTDREMRPKNA
jgi:hypothetical protein